MHVDRLVLKGFKRFPRFELTLDPAFNVVVGDNEAGKSSVLEALDLVLSGQYDGRLIQYAIDPYLFNVGEVGQFFEIRRNGGECPPPSITIEAYLAAEPADPEIAALKGTNNSRNENCAGLVMEIAVDPQHQALLKDYPLDETNPTLLPVEFYRASWRSFSGESVSHRRLGFRPAKIDTEKPRVYRGPNRYLTQLVDDVLTQAERRDLALEYRRLQHSFSSQPAVKTLNDHLGSQPSPASGKKLSVKMDLSSRASWDSAISAHLDELPFDIAGKGEQCRVQLHLALAAARGTQPVLIEEPENHLSHSNLAMLLDDLRKHRQDRQVIITTHSAFVLNKLGIDSLRLLSFSGNVASLSGLDPDTRNYFMKLPGYDTLRLLLSRRCLLVEGPSDELIVQRAYVDRHGRLPLEDRVDVVSVRALAFKRFLELADPLGIEVRVITDNDGNVAGVRKKYSEFLTTPRSHIRICFDQDESCGTLEPQLLKANSLRTLNEILGTKFDKESELLTYMAAHKTDCALTLFQTTKTWAAPQYIIDAVN